MYEGRITIWRTVTLTERDAEKLDWLARVTDRPAAQVMRMLTRRAAPGDLVYGVEEPKESDAR